MVATVTEDEAATIRAEILRPAAEGPGPRGSLGVFSTDDVGFFYVIQLEPDHDPGRFKAGFTVDLDGRLQTHRCSAPFAEYRQSWPCKRAWERTAIECTTAGCEQIHTEVFRVASLELVVQRVDSFFALMPKLEMEDEDADGIGCDDGEAAG